MFEQIQELITSNEYLQKALSALLTLLIGMIILRLAGKKSIAQMTLPMMIFVLILGSVLGSYLAKPQKTLIMVFTAFVILTVMYLVEKGMQKWNKLENLLVGKSVPIIIDGELQVENIRKNKFTVDQIEIELRLKGIPSISMIKTATIEPNGQIGVELMPKYEPVKKKEFDHKFDLLYEALMDKKTPPMPTENMNNIFEESKEEDNIQTQNNLLE